MTNKYYDSLPKKRMASGVLYLNEVRELLIVKPTYRDHWLIPGGVVEINESPLQAARREVKEELGIDAGDLEFICVD